MIVATDLDGTVIFTGGSIEKHICVEYYNNSPLSFMTKEGYADLLNVSLKTTLIPVTTRTTAQYHRVKLPGGLYDWAITTNGGVVLHNDSPDLEWEAHIKHQLMSQLVSYEEMIHIVRSYSEEETKCSTLREVPEKFFYLVGEPKNSEPEFWEHISAQVALYDWRVSVQHRKAYFVPNCIDKGKALSYVRDLLDMPILAAAGDSSLDFSFVSLATHQVAVGDNELSSFLGKDAERILDPKIQAETKASQWLLTQAENYADSRGNILL